MMRTILAWAVMLGAMPASAWTPPLIPLRVISGLSNAEVSSRPSVAFEATVVYYYRAGADLDVEDGGRGIFVRNTRDVALAPGDRVLVMGRMEPSFLPYVIADEIRVLRHGKLPPAEEATFDELMGSLVNCRLVRVRGVIRAADLVNELRAPRGRMQLLMDGGYVDLQVITEDGAALKNFMDDEVEVTGATGRWFDDKMQQVGAKVKVSSLRDIKVVREGTVSPWNLPLTPLGKIDEGYHVRDLTRRLRVHGTVTYYEPGSLAVLQNGAGSLRVSVLTSEPIGIGEVVEATGFPDLHDHRLLLDHAEIRRTGRWAAVKPQPATWRQLAAWEKNRADGHANDLVSIEGRVVSEVREAAQDEYVLRSNGRLFTAIYHHPRDPAAPPPMVQVPLGARVRVTGICLVTSSDPRTDEVPFDILLRSFQDIAVVAPPPLLNTRTLMYVIWVLLGVVVVVGARSWFLEWRLRRETAAVAYLERRRASILEQINAARPLKEILEQITEIVSYRLLGAPCWCVTVEGAKVGNWQSNIPGQRVAEATILGRRGNLLGTIFAAVGQTSPRAREETALAMAAGLAALAIETAQLYNDLVHRSEYDLLTDVDNRFSMERKLDLLMDAARRSGGAFGVVYIDLNEFKLVNDLYGHGIGDLYLQESALRMQRQLRPGDTLARLGGDEFAVLVPGVRGRDDVGEIALRLERCFDEPFKLDEWMIEGSAAVGIALFPVDGETRDTLLDSADKAMYAAKHAVRQNGRLAGRRAQAEAAGSAA